jgi:hypothetical protein
MRSTMRSVPAGGSAWRWVGRPWVALAAPGRAGDPHGAATPRGVAMWRAVPVVA